MRRALPARMTGLIICCLGVAATAAWSFHLGQDINFDQRSYHRYSVWALLNGRIFADNALQGVQVLVNQLFNVPVILAIEHLPPRVVGLLLGGIHGLNFVLVYLIAMEVQVQLGDRPSRYVAVGAGLIGMTAPMTLAEIGTTFGDDLLSLGVLGALLLAMVARRRGQKRLLLGAALVMGVTCGLKYSMVPYQVAFFAFCFVTEQDARLALRLRRLAAVVAASAVGFFAAAGWWMWQLAIHYQNPLAPVYNNVFRSEWFAEANNSPYGPTSIADFVLGPFRMARGGAVFLFLANRDPRWLALVMLIAANGLFIILRRLGRTGGDRIKALERIPAAVLVYGLVAYVVWHFQYHYQRFLIPLELLSGVLGWILLRQLIRDRVLRSWVAVVLALGMIVGTKSVEWGHRPWGSQAYDAVLPDIGRADGALLVEAGGGQVKVFVPEFPRSDSYIQLNGGSASIMGPRTDRDLRERIARHRGTILLLREPTFFDAEQLTRYGLVVDDAGCQPMKNSMRLKLDVCPLRKT